MTKQHAKYYQKIINGEMINLNDPEFHEAFRDHYELQCFIEDLELIKEIDQLEEAMQNGTLRLSERQADYIIDLIRTKEYQKRFSRNSIKSIWNNINNSFWGWIICKFKMLPAQDDVLFAPKNNSEFSSLLFRKIIIPFVFLILLIGTFISVSPEDNQPTTSSFKNQRQKYISRNNARLINYSSAVNVMMAPKTQFKKITNSSIQLTKGELWLDVDKNGRGFQIETDQVTVRVTGTCFGVHLLPDNLLEVSVSEGTVQVIGKFETHSVTEGQTLILKDGLFKEFNSNDSTKDKPEWVTSLQQDRIDQLNSDNLVAYWNFDSFEKRASDIQIPDQGPRGYHAIADEDSLPEFEVPSVPDSQFNKAIRLEGFSKQKLIPINKDQMSDDLSVDFTVMCWAQRDLNQKGYSRLFTNTGHSSWRWGIVHNKIELSFIYYYWKQARMKSLSIPAKEHMPVGQWTHLAISVSRSNNLASFIVNGKTVETFELVENSIPPGNGKWRIGAGQIAENGLSTWGGELDELRIYDQALSSSDIKILAGITVNHNQVTH